MLLRADDSPLTIAYRDPMLHGQGLASDRMGDAMAFFDLTRGEAHYLLCDCHYYAGTMPTPQMMAMRVREIARQMSVGEVWSKVQSVLKFW